MSELKYDLFDCGVVLRQLKRSYKGKKKKLGINFVVEGNKEA